MLIKLFFSIDNFDVRDELIGINNIPISDNLVHPAFNPIVGMVNMVDDNEPNHLNSDSSYNLQHQTDDRNILQQSYVSDSFGLNDQQQVSLGTDATKSPTTRLGSDMVDSPNGSHTKENSPTFGDPNTPPPLDSTPKQVASDLRVIGKFWSAAVEEEEANEGNSVPEFHDNSFQVVLSKSQKKKIRQKNKNTQRSDVCNTLSRAGSTSISF